MTKTTEPVLEPCPMCNAVNERRIVGGAPFFVECGECGFFTPRFNRQDEAIAAWNTRTHPAPSPDVAGLVERFTKFVSEWGKSRQYGDVIYGLHGGSEREVELTATDLREAATTLATLSAQVAELQKRLLDQQDTHNTFAQGAVTEVATLIAENERLTARVSVLEDALKRSAEIVRLHNNRQNEKVEDVIYIAIAALETKHD